MPIAEPQLPLSKDTPSDLNQLIGLLSEQKINPNSEFKGTTLLIAAIEQGYQPLILVLLQDPLTDVNLRDVTGKTPLVAAAQKGDIKLVQALLDRKADPNTTFFSLPAAGYTSDEVIKNLLPAFEMPDGQAHITDRMKSLKHNPDVSYGTSARICHGYVGMTMLMFLDPKNSGVDLAGLEKLKKMINRMNEIAPEIFSEYMETLNNLRKAIAVNYKRDNPDVKITEEVFKKQLTEDQYLTLEILNFFDGIEVIQSLQEHKELNPQVEYQSMEASFPLLESNELKKLGGTSRADTFLGIFMKKEHNELEVFLSTFQEHFSSLDFPVSLVLSSVDHSTGLNYNPLTKNWLYLDPKYSNPSAEFNKIILESSDNTQVADAIWDNHLFNDTIPLYLYEKMPENMDDHRHSYILVSDKLFYVSTNGIQEVAIQDLDQFLDDVESLSQNQDNPLLLSIDDVEVMISENSGHYPEVFNHTLLSIDVYCADAYRPKLQAVLRSVQYNISEISDTRPFQDLFVETPEKLQIAQYELASSLDKNLTWDLFRKDTFHRDRFENVFKTGLRSDLLQEYEKLLNQHDVYEEYLKTGSHYLITKGSVSAKALENEMRLFYRGKKDAVISFLEEVLEATPVDYDEKTDNNLIQQVFQQCYQRCVEKDPAMKEVLAPLLKVVSKSELKKNFQSFKETYKENRDEEPEDSLNPGLGGG